MLLTWCGWHNQGLCNFMKMLTWACYEAFGHHRRTKGVPRQRQRKWCHDNISMIRQLVEMSVQKKVGVSVSCKRMVGWSRLPGVPHVGGMETRNAQATTGTRFEHEQLIHHNHSFTGVVSAVIPSKRAFSEWIGFDVGGSSCSRVAEGSSGTRRR